MKKSFVVVFIHLMLLVTSNLKGQEPVAYEQYLDGMNKSIAHSDQLLTHSTEKYLRQLQKREAQLLNKLHKVDSSKTAAFLATSKSTYENYIRKLENAEGKLSEISTGKYFPYLDSLGTSLKFLKQGKTIFSDSKDLANKLDGCRDQMLAFQNKLHETEQIEQFIQGRKEQLNSLLNQYSNLSNGFFKEFNRYKECAFYYSKQLKEYKEAINEPDKLFKKFLATLNTIPAFQDFMRKNSMLASLFPTPDYVSNPGLLNGLQTIGSVQAAVQQQLSSGQANLSMQSIQQQVQQGQSELQQFKNSMSNLVNRGGGDISMPDFKPNNQKTKTLRQRVEFGMSLQARKASYFFPITTDLNLSMGYKLSDKKVIGLAIIGKAGWGKGWDNIKVTAEGVGTRLFMDWKAKGSLWITGGAELNYLQPIKSLEHIKAYSNWSKSALLGITRKYRVNKKISGNVQVLYDFLYKWNTPATEPIVFRVGYNF